MRFGSLTRAPRSRAPARRERAALVGLAGRGAARVAAERSLEELAGLAHAAGGHVVLQVLQERDTPDAALFLGRGRVDRLKAECAELGAETVIVDNELSPAQLRNLEQTLDRKVIDRTQLILDIFARRARTREGKLQVELAQLKYLMPRLIGARSALSRLGGGIGTRGPGEAKLETDRRRVRERISVVAREIETVRQRRSRSRQRRHKAALPTVVLVGYTNAGKTTLFNALTRGRATASDALFVTLDPLTRHVRLPDGQRFVVADTVGFIDRLPHTLVAAFRATLEEASQADLLLHVVDAASPERRTQMMAVERVLEEIGATAVPRLDVFNKWDLLSTDERRRVRDEQPHAVCVSALRGTGRRELLIAIQTLLSLDTRRVKLVFDERDEADRERIARLYRQARVVRHESAAGRISIEADISRRALERLGWPQGTR